MEVAKDVLRVLAGIVERWGVREVEFEVLDAVGGGGKGEGEVLMFCRIWMNMWDGGEGKGVS